MAVIVSKQIKIPSFKKEASNYEIGDRVYTTVNGTRTPFIVVHQGKPSSIYSDSCIGTWLLSEYLLSPEAAWNNSSVNDYANSSGHSQLNSSYLNSLSSSVRGIIQTVKIPYRPNSGTTSTVSSGENGLSCKIFSLSVVETGCTSRTNMPADGAKLDYFLSGTSTNAKNLRRAKLDSTATTYYNWWARTPYSASTVYSVWYISNTGDFASTKAQTFKNFFLRPAFVIPYTTLIDKKTNDIVG